MNCHQCGGIVTTSDRFCEECGVNLVTTTAPQQIDTGCQKCGATPSQIDSDKYCIQCGFRQVERSTETSSLDLAPNFAGATDRGRRHHQNEDAIALKILAPDTYIIVVCDGVSSSQHPELASQSAANACIQAIEIAISQGTSDLSIAIVEGVDAALQAVAQIEIDPASSIDPSSTTIVTAIVRNNIATIGWLGDSRAYWIASEKSLQLTQDDSWMREAIESGYTPAEAEASPYAHAIVRWLGADTADDGKPNLTTFSIPDKGYLLLCTDGLWNYAPDPAYLHHLIQQSPAPESLAISHHLISYANQQGGQDNITVGILVMD
jgi:PPM family protein phosphatase